MGWRWKPVYTKRRGPIKVRVSPLTPRKMGASVKLGPVSITSTGRVYLFGARVF